MKIAFIYTLLFITTSLLSQSKQVKKGDVHFTHKQYSSSIKQYRLALKKAPNDLNIQYKLFKALQLSNNYEESYIGFRKLIENDYEIKNLYFDYAMLAENNHDYAVAKEALEIHLLKFPEDKKAIELYHSIGQIGKYYDSKNLVEISLLSTNTTENDLGAFYYQSDFHFLTGGFDKGKRVYDWDKQHYLDFHKLDSKAKNKCDPSFPELDHNLHNGPGVYSTKLGVLFYTRNEKLHTTDQVNEKISRLQIYSFDPMSSQKPKAISLNKLGCSIAHPTILPHGNRLYFSSDVEGGYGESDIYYSDYEENIGWSTPVNLGSVINTELKENFPFILNDTTLLFSSNGHGGLGGLDLFKAIIKKDGTVSIENMRSPFNSTRDDFGIVVNPNNINEGYFSSNRTGGKGNDDIYSFSYKKTQIWIQVISSKSNKPVTYASVDIENKRNKYSYTIKEPIQSIDITEADINLGLNLKIKHYYYHDLDLQCVGFQNKDTILVKMTEKNLVPIYGTVIDQENHKPISDVSVRLLGGDQTPDKSTSLGHYSIYSKTKTPQKFIVYKAGYLSKEIEMDSASSLQDVELEKLKAGMEIVLDKIHYEYDRYHITSQSQEVLDKLVKIMKDNPTIEIEISTHTDVRGSLGYNQELASQRSLSVIKYLTDQGVSSFRVRSKIFGESSPVNSCEGDCSEEEHHLNRRTEFVIVKI